ELVHIGLAASAEYNFPGSVRPLERFFHGMLRLRSSRQMLRQAIITSKTANAIAVANTVIIVANERTYITPYANVRNTLFPSKDLQRRQDGASASCPSLGDCPEALNSRGRRASAALAARRRACARSRPGGAGSARGCWRRSWLTVSNSERKHEAPASTSGRGLSPPPVRILSGRVAGGVISPKS